MQADLFTPRKLITLISIGTLALLGTAYLMIFGDPGAGETAGANAFSYSAIGHAAFVETLTRLGVSVHINRGHSHAQAYDHALLVLAEPADDELGHQALQQLQQAPAVLVVLPKRDGEASPQHPAWLADSGLIGSPAIDRLLHEIDPKGHIGRSSGRLTLASAFGNLNVSLDEPQVIYSTLLTPVISRPGGGILLGKLTVGQTLVWVLSDPDLIANHGLGHADNAAAAVDIIRDALPTGGFVVFDEVIHGFLQETNLLKDLLHLPLVIASAAFMLTVVLLLAGAFRFGGARPVVTVLAAGKATLINNAAALLASGGRHNALTDRYLQVAFSDIARRLGQTKTLSDTALVAWLDREAGRRGLTSTASTIMAAARGHKPTAMLLRQLDIWTKEMTHGVSG